MRQKPTARTLGSEIQTLRDHVAPSCSADEFGCLWKVLPSRVFVGFGASIAQVPSEYVRVDGAYMHICIYIYTHTHIYFICMHICIIYIYTYYVYLYLSTLM